ncbi:MAG TPA: SIMPL domain-containing protein [Candidatus Limiplasma sp.]|nr:SIMPL domain-containing protein [Candidatus Limiplasma sp.]
MKKFLCVLLVIMLSLVCVSALAQSNTVSAIGTATISLEPDIASFSVGITTQDTLVTTAQTANAAAMQTVLNALTAQGVSQDDLQTDSYSVYPVYSYETDTPTVTGYEISNTVTVIVRNVDQLPSLLDAAVEAGANNVYSLGFQSSETTSAYDQALKAAAQDALRKASMMAQAIGRESGATISLEELSTSGDTYTSSRTYSLDSSYATPIETGMVTVSAQVLAVVELK